MNDSPNLPSPYRGEIPPERILEGVELTDHNSRELLKDAKLLYKLRRYPRAVSLAVLALEEHTKKAFLLCYGFAQHDPELKKFFWRQYRNHKIKSSVLVQRMNLFGQVTDERAPALTDAFGKESEFLKQAGLYVDAYELGEEKFWLSPSKAVDKGTAKAYLSVVSRAIGSRENRKTKAKLRKNREQLISSATSTSVDENAVAMFAVVREQMEEMGEEEAVRRIDELLDSLDKSTRAK